jgi:hypothetical protein
MRTSLTSTAPKPHCRSSRLSHCGVSRYLPPPAAGCSVFRKKYLGAAHGT